MATAKRPAKSQYVRHDVPEGEVIASGSGTREHVLRTLSPSECFDLIEPGGVGRVGFASADGIMMLPVNFAVSRKTIVFRTAPDTLLAVYSNGQVSFEADHFDEALHTGWSVLVTGRAHPVTGERELRRLEEGMDLEPWAAGPRDVYVRITPTRISGRRLYYRSDSVCRPGTAPHVPGVPQHSSPRADPALPPRPPGLTATM